MSILPLNSRLKAKKTQCSRRLSMAKEATELLSYNDSTIRRTVAAGFQDNNYEERIRCQSTTLADFRRQVPRTLRFVPEKNDKNLQPSRDELWSPVLRLPRRHGNYFSDSL